MTMLRLNIMGESVLSWKREGLPLEPLILEMLIAAQALSIGCTLVTNNEKEFKRVPFLKMVNWI